MTSHNWTGLLVEPKADQFQNLVEKRRKAWLLPQCFSTKTTPEVLEFDWHDGGEKTFKLIPVL